MIIKLEDTMNLFLSVDAAGAAASNISPWSSLIWIALMLGMMFFMVFLPQRKQQKKDAEMRSSIEVGDGVTTIGGIVGRVVSIKEDTILMETGSDRNKLRVLKSAIASVEKLDMNNGSDNKETK